MHRATRWPISQAQRFAYNEPVSQSGWAAPSTHAAKTGTRFGAYIQTGAHVASAKAVADGDADIAGIDALTWALICECEPWAQKLREVERTTPTPGLPYITSLANNPARIRAAVEQAIAALSAADRAALHLQGLVVIPEETYLAVPTPPPAARLIQVSNASLAGISAFPSVTLRV